MSDSINTYPGAHRNTGPSGGRTLSNKIYKRIGIFVFYDATGVVDDYVEVLLKSMRKEVQKLIVVVNGVIERSGYQRLKRISHKVYIRDNVGYDAGAYKDALTQFLKDEICEYWDEIILFNDTFYGPIHPWKEVFQRMERKNADFWGLSKFPKGNYFDTGEAIPEHIQGYFLVCRRPLFMSDDWRIFWNQLEYPRNYQEAVENFEIYFSQYFWEKGYISKIFTDDYDAAIANCENPTMWCFDKLIRSMKFPIIKRRVFCLLHLDEVDKTIEYINNYTNYDVRLISSHLERLCSENRHQVLAPFNPIQLCKFCKEHKGVFIYGYGIYGKGIAKYLEYKGLKYKGVIVSEKDEKNDKLFVYRNMTFDEGDGIILALGEKAFYEVYPMVKENLKDAQLYFANYDNDRK